MKSTHYEMSSYINSFLIDQFKIINNHFKIISDNLKTVTLKYISIYHETVFEKVCMIGEMVLDSLL